MLADCQAVATIPVSDLARARAFYVDRLAFKPLMEMEDGGLILECANQTAFGVFVSQGSASGTHTQMSFATADVDAEVADLRARGIELERFDMPGAMEEDGVYRMGDWRGAWFRDPEGNLLAISQLPEAPTPTS